MQVSPDEIREARLKEALAYWSAPHWLEVIAKRGPIDLRGDQVIDFEVVLEAARAYADLLENGQEQRAEERELSVMPWMLVVPGPGRYLAVRLEEE